MQKNQVGLTTALKDLGVECDEQVIHKSDDDALMTMQLFKKSVRIWRCLLLK